MARDVTITTPQRLRRQLGPWALTAMGIGCIIGTGIFVLTGIASATRAGPGLMFSFVIAGCVAALAALCYAEVSSSIPLAGSAYTYTFAAFGEIAAWIIGWDLILEYSLGAASVSIGWSGYFSTVLQTAFHVNIPSAFTHAPGDPVSGIVNAPAVVIILIMTALLAKGTRESSAVNTVIVAIKLLVVLFFIAIGFRHVDFANYHLPAGPLTHAGGLLPFGWPGVLSGAAFMFFAYLGFDAVSTSAEECKDPKRDLPFGILMSLAICTVLYIAVVAILNGLVPFYKLNVPNPVAFAVAQAGMPWGALVISLGAIAGLTTVLLVMMFAQSRVLFAMSRDGLLPSVLSRVHPAWGTPYVSTIVFGIFIAAFAGFTPLTTIASLSVMGTLAAFMLVAIAVPVLRRRAGVQAAFRVPFGPYAIPVIAAVSALGFMYYLGSFAIVVFGIPLPWLGFVVWLGMGLVVYFVFARRRAPLDTSGSFDTSG
ncbi:MAG TPA: amino acid permease [Candidatus Baltobacteraceae bacterium]|jgi:APA family basic amino acid/polyamine antiporter|nr:amino acid permease [Candidatus Baltobacteraceae bacterium]